MQNPIVQAKGLVGSVRGQKQRDSERHGDNSICEQNASTTTGLNLVLTLTTPEDDLDCKALDWILSLLLRTIWTAKLWTGFSHYS